MTFENHIDQPKDEIDREVVGPEQPVGEDQIAPEQQPAQDTSQKSRERFKSQVENVRAANNKLPPIIKKDGPST